MRDQRGMAQKNGAYSDRACRSHVAANMRKAHMQAYKHSFAALVRPPTLRGTEGGSGHNPEPLFL
jgi:hypothetical protein